MQAQALGFNSTSSGWQLRDKQLLTLKRAQGERIVCLSGRLLITVFDQQRDIELLPGDSFLIPNQGLTLIEGLDDAVLRIEQEPSLSSLALQILGRVFFAGRARPAASGTAGDVRSVCSSCGGRIG